MGKFAQQDKQQSSFPYMSEIVSIGQEVKNSRCHQRVEGQSFIDTLLWEGIGESRQRRRIDNTGSAQSGACQYIVEERVHVTNAQGKPPVMTRRVISSLGTEQRLVLLKDVYTVS